MRLSQAQVSAFISAITPYVLEKERVELRLHGSRLDDSRKGGDIDLLLTTHSETQRHTLAQNKAAILAKIFMQIDEEKIDITICNLEADDLDPFIHTVLGKSKILEQW